ncbi:MAG: isopentenyl-diphosphate Delta-isomerase [Flavobacteriaceae bacterium]|jgi:isopentenyl-diphosphate delta-isomerase|nr:isopentenyl-diphosphate Delta-isomerase [Flavobacteriaceae bacterium]
MKEYVVIVNKKDEQLGLMEKQEAHIKAVLHRAFSIFIFNRKGEFLLQRRAKVKYHSPLKWTNTCCSHPRDGETYLEAAHRRLQEELGFDCTLAEKFHFIYKTGVGDGLTEHEFDRVFTGIYEKDFCINPNEVDTVKWISLQDLMKELHAHPEQFTEWFKIIFEKYHESIIQ